MSWTWTWENFGRWWGTERPDVLHLQRVGHYWVTEKQHLNKQILNKANHLTPHNDSGLHIINYSKGLRAKMLRLMFPKKGSWDSVSILQFRHSSWISSLQTQDYNRDFCWNFQSAGLQILDLLVPTTSWVNCLKERKISEMKSLNISLPLFTFLLSLPTHSVYFLPFCLSLLIYLPYWFCFLENLINRNQKTILETKQKYKIGTRGNKTATVASHNKNGLTPSCCCC